MSHLQRIREGVARKTRFNPEDLLGVDVVCSAFVANLWRADDERCWTFLVGPPSCGKSLTFNLFKGYHHAYFLDDCSTNALVSGFGQDPRDPSKSVDPSLLPRINGKVVLMPDFSTMMGNDPLKASKILADLRAAFDGTLAKATGLGQRSHHSRFGMICAVTTDIDDFLLRQSSLGERFLIYRMGHTEEVGSTAQESKLNGMWDDDFQKPKWLPQLRTLVQSELDALLGELKANPSLTCGCPLEFRQAINSQAILTAALRTKPRESRPDVAERPNRIFQQIAHMARAHALLDGRSQIDGTDVRFTAAIARNCIHPALCEVAQAFWGDGHPLTVKAGLSPDELTSRTWSARTRLDATINQWAHCGLLEPHPVHPERFRWTDPTAQRLRASGLLTS